MDRLDAIKSKGKSDSLLDFANRLSFKEKKVIQDLFKQIDVDGDGAISKSELGEMMKGLNINHSQKDLDAMFLQLDSDKNGSITFSEFLNGMKYLDKTKRMGDKLQKQNSVSNFIESMEESQLKEMEELFNLMDDNKDGVVSKREMYNLMKKMGQDPTKQEIEELFAALDINGDGVLDFKEFMSGMKWLKKGFLMNKNIEVPNEKSASPTTNTNAEEKNVERNIILENCLKEIVSKGMEVAESYYLNKNYALCQVALETLDFDSILAMEVFVGPLTTETQRDHYTKMKRRLAQHLPK